MKVRIKTLEELEENNNTKSPTSCLRTLIADNRWNILPNNRIISVEKIGESNTHYIWNRVEGDFLITRDMIDEFIEDSGSEHREYIQEVIPEIYTMEEDKAIFSLKSVCGIERGRNGQVKILFKHNTYMIIHSVSNREVEHLFKTYRKFHIKSYTLI